MSDNDALDSSAAKQLRDYVERIESLEEDKANAANDIKEVYGEAKSFGLDTAVIRKLISLMGKQPHERAENDLLLYSYARAINFDVPVPGAPGLGHNSSALDESMGQKLKTIIERIENLTDDKKNVAADIKDVYGEAKAMGYDVKIIRIIIRLRKQDPVSRENEEQLVTLYKMAVGL